MPRSFVLMGLRGSGKTTVGRALADQARLPFVDLDDEVLLDLGRDSVAEIWDQLGEPAFREAETRTLKAALERHTETPCVLALGGGAPTAPGAADLLRSAVEHDAIALVYLRAQPGVLRERIASGDPNRPSLTGAGTLDEIESIFEARDPLYRELASVEIEIGNHGVEELADTIAQWGL